jgi:hypothetical protein
MLTNHVEYLAALVVAFFVVLHKTRRPKLAAVPACGVLLQGIVAMDADPTTAWFVVAIMLTVWSLLVDFAWRDYVRGKNGGRF